MSRKRVLKSPGAAWVAAALGAWVVAAACRTMVPTASSASPEVLPSPSLDGLVASPAIRVGILPSVPRVSIGAHSGVRVLARGEGRDQPHWRPLDRATFLPGADGQVKLVETGEELDLATVVPAEASELLDADARPYRGLLEVRPAADGSLTVVNVVNVEEYLRGVVPNELSPLAFPQIEAHKAQAVAARTWVMAHLGDYSSKGYDVCATQACQVYRGQASEQALTDAAIDQTRGVIATWRGRPISAYYTSTCGGHTEDGETIFEVRAPYLRGVTCAPNRSGHHALHTTAEPRRGLPGAAAVPRSLAILEALGVVDATIAEPATLAGVPSDNEIRSWMTRLQAPLDRLGCTSLLTGGLARRASLAEYVVASVCGRDGAAAPPASAEGDPLHEVADAADLVGDGERQAAAFLLQAGLLRLGPDHTLKPNGGVTRAEVLDLLAGLAERVGSPEWRRGTFAGLTKDGGLTEGGDLAEGRLTVVQGGDTESYDLGADVRLFRNLGGAHAGATELRLNIGDPLSFVTQKGRVVYLEARQDAPGFASRHQRWEAQLTPQDIARKLARYGTVGEVRDIVPRRLGVSGRVVELEVQGTTGDLLLKGLKVRRGLGLRENLFVIDRETNLEGEVERFVISGRGWGHGVGLCQVGASGMAQAGSTFEGILQHYYTGIRLAQMADIS